jgi:hypothetical protein
MTKRTRWTVAAFASYKGAWWATYRAADGRKETRVLSQDEYEKATRTTYTLPGRPA